MVVAMAACGGGDSEAKVTTEASEPTSGPSVVNVGHQRSSSGELGESTPEGSGPADPTSGPQFWETVRAFPIWETTRLAPDPATLEHLIGRSDAIVRGTLDALEVVEQPWAPVPALAGPSSQVVVRVTVSDVVDLQSSEDGANQDPIVWDITAWSGDPARSDAVVDEIRQQVGSGPIGAEVILHLAPVTNVAAPEDSPDPMFSISGLLATGETVQELSIAGGGPLADFSGLDELEAEIRALTGT